MRPVSAVLPLAAAAWLAACASPQAERAVAARTALVGLPKAQLLSCAGVPSRSLVEGGAEYLSYVAQPRGGGGFRPSLGIGIGGGDRSGVGVGVGIGVPLILGGGDPARCEATFVLRDGVVRELRYHTAGDGRDLAACASIVQSCLPAGPG